MLNLQTCSPLSHLRLKQSVKQSLKHCAKLFVLVTLCLFVLLFGPSWNVHAQLRIEISGVGASQIPVAVANFQSDANVPQDVAAIVRADLARSGLFKQVDAGAASLNENSPINYGEWKSRGADALLLGSVTRLADGRYDVRFRLQDAVKQTSLGGQALVSSPELLRYTAHRIADYVYEKLLGEPGIFSTRIAYVVKQGGGYALKIADTDGQNEQTALVSKEPIISPAWSPDGSRLAYVSFETRKPVIYSHNIATGQRVPVANFKGSNSSPAWSPDGKQLAVVLSRDGLQQVYVVNADGSGLRRITQSSGIDTDPFFAPDGQSIYYTSDRGGAPQIYRVSLAGGESARITFKGDYNVRPRISPDGKWLAYISRREGKYQLTLQELSTGVERTLTDTSQDESPSFAPNGRFILYETKLGRADALAMVSTDGRVRQRLTINAADTRDPAWGPFVK